jgi:hypothetical protein
MKHCINTLSRHAPSAKDCCMSQQLAQYSPKSIIFHTTIETNVICINEIQNYIIYMQFDH